MDNKTPVPVRSLRWLALLGGTVAVHLLVVALLIFVAMQQIGFVGGQVVLLVAILCLPAAWSVFILWKFKSFAERLVGIITAASSLLELSDMIHWLM